MSISEQEMDSVADQWIAGWQAINDETGQEQNPSVFSVNDWLYGGEHELLWRFILSVYKKPMSERVFAVLAAGPMEDLLAHFGSSYIERVETLARQDSTFKHLLGGVWKNSMTDEVWDRLQKARGEAW